MVYKIFTFSYFFITIFSLQIDETAIAAKVHERQQHSTQMYQNFVTNE